MRHLSGVQVSGACTLGVLAHVDAGKTTLCEQLLYLAGAIRAPGRVDHGSAAMDSDPIERERGITVFSGQAWFEWRGRRFTLIDTPGHVDFAAEAERALLALDAAVLVSDGAAGVDAHTAGLFRMARERGVPVLLFLNKADLPGFDRGRALEQIARRLSPHAVPIWDGAPDVDALSLLDEGFMARWLDGGADEAAAWDALGALFRRGEAFPVLCGAALRGEGVEALLNALCRLSLPAPAADGPPHALAYQVRHGANGERICFVKLLGGVLRPRDAFCFPGGVEKAHQLRLYRGAAYTPVDEARAGDTVGVTGLSTPRCGDRFTPDGLTAGGAPRTQPVLTARVEALDGTPGTRLMEILRLLEDEDPTLRVAWDAAHAAATVRVMGQVHSEVLCRLLNDRYGVRARLLPPLVLYRETIAAPVEGFGHYEPLRHYAEVRLLLSPAPRGSGVAFDSRCHVDDLPAPYQSLIRTHVLEREHRGVLTGAPLADVRVTLLCGRAHLKHTEGGDFREAVYRAVRQGLMKAQSVLLEPWYRFTLALPAACVGRAMTDIAAMGGCCDAPEELGGETRLCGRAPVRAFLDYPAQVRAYTHGAGSVLLAPDGYDPCRDAGAVIAEAAYNPDADKENPSGSVFCAHGAGYFVPWNEV